METIDKLMCEKCGKVFIPDSLTNYEIELEGEYRGTYCWECITGEKE